MDHHNKRGQILIEAIVFLSVLAICFLMILSKLQSVKEQQSEYSISKKSKRVYSK